MTRKNVADDQYGQLCRRLGEVARRVDEGSIPFDTTMQSLQLIVEGDTSGLSSVPKWREQDGVIYFSVTSDGTTGPQWIERLEKKGFRIGNYAKSIFYSDDFKPTNGVTTQIAVLKGEMFADSDRTTKNIRAEADKRKLIKPNAEVACLIREKFADEEIKAMDLWWIVTMHEPIKDSDGDPSLLSADRNVDGRWLSAGYDRPDRRWNRSNGFAFAFAQVLCP